MTYTILPGIKAPIESCLWKFINWPSQATGVLLAFFSDDEECMHFDASSNLISGKLCEIFNL
jgi:hypothetical protein